MEYLDLLDHKGQPNGQKKLRSEVHRDGDWHAAVHAWIVTSNVELLLQKRSPQKDNNPNMWDVSIAGHIPSGEDTALTVVREAEEELGLKLRPEDLELLFTVAQERKTDKYNNREFDDVYLIHRDLNLGDMVIQKDEVTEVKFLPFPELERLIKSGHPDYVDHPREFERLFPILYERYT